MTSAFDAWELKQRLNELLEDIEEVVRMAEELSWPPQPIYVSNRIREELVPALYDARTYIEVGQLDAPAISERLMEARLVTADLSSEDKTFERLFSRLRVISENADNAATERTCYHSPRDDELMRAIRFSHFALLISPLARTPTMT